MPLNPLAKPKIIEWFEKMPMELKNKEYYNIANHAQGLQSLSDIFTEDEEWAKELFDSSLILTNFAVSLIRRIGDESIPEEKLKKITELITKYLEPIKTSISSDNWLQYHKAVRDLGYELNKLL